MIRVESVLLRCRHTPPCQLRQLVRHSCETSSCTTVHGLQHPPVRVNVKQMGYCAVSNLRPVDLRTVRPGQRSADRSSSTRPGRACAGRREMNPMPDAPPTDRQLADRLVETGRLNAWQAEQLLDGRTKFNLGPYLIIDSIGQGATGQVFKAQHEKIGRIVAVKVLPRDKSTPEAIANFTREIRAMAEPRSPEVGGGARRRPGRKRLLPGDGVRARHGPAKVGPAQGTVEHVGGGLDHFSGGGRAGVRPCPRGSSIAT